MFGSVPSFDVFWRLVGALTRRRTVASRRSGPTTLYLTRSGRPRRRTPGRRKQPDGPTGPGTARRAGSNECENGEQPSAGLARADLTGASLAGADLRRADLRYATVNFADLTGACLFGARLSGARLATATLVVADLR